MHWFSTALVIVLIAGTVLWTGWLLRRLFVTEPASAVVEPRSGRPPHADSGRGADPTGDRGANAEEPNA